MTKKKFRWWKCWLITFLIPVVFFIGIPNFRKDSGPNYRFSGLNGCSWALSDINSILKSYYSVEKISELNLNNDIDKVISTLLKEGLIGNDWPYKKASRSSVIGRDKCKYLISGDLTKDGFVYCTYHGSINYKEDGKIIYYGNGDAKHDIKKAKIQPSKEYYKDERARKINNFLDKWGIVTVGEIIVFLLAIFL